MADLKLFEKTFLFHCPALTWLESSEKPSADLHPGIIEPDLNVGRKRT
jgi:hypothetical protein